ncbi:MAG: redox-sensitive transcriptional activator SoxR [Acidimicrobiia bacterium]
MTIGDVANRTGVATSALRYYEDRGLISSQRTDGNQRRYRRSVLRTVSIIRAAQEVGLSLNEIADALATLPTSGPPSKADWSRLARSWEKSIDQRIKELTGLRDDLSGCSGWGCLSRSSCALFNPNDRAARSGTGARYIVGDRPPIEKTTTQSSLSD